MLSLIWTPPARLVLAGRPVLASPMRLGDLARLEHWAAGMVGMVPDGLRAALAIPDAPARRAELRRLYEIGLRGGVTFGHPDVAAWLRTPDGMAQELAASLRVRDRRTGRLRRPSPAWCRPLAMGATPDEWHDWAAVAWAAHPRDAAMRAIDGEIGVTWPTPRERPDDQPGDGWEAAAWSVCKATGWTFRELSQLTLYQWDIARSDGSPRKVSALEPEGYPVGIDPRDFDREVLAKRGAFFEGA